MEFLIIALAAVVVDIISFNPDVESKANVCGRLKTEEEAIRAGIEYVEERLKSL